MAATNVARPRPLNHEGVPVVRPSPKQELRRCLMACLLWEDQFYVDGQDIAERIAALVREVDAEEVAAMAIEARTDMKLRHAPLLVCRELARIGKLKAETLAACIQRADEITEFLSLYRQGREGGHTLNKLSWQVRRGLGMAFQKFNEYQLAKYDRAGDGKIRLRDAMFLCHPKPKDEAQAELWRRLASNKLATPDTWEVALSGGAEKRETFERLIAVGRLGALAILRNLRNMQNAGVPDDIIRGALESMNTDRVLPFRFITAARYAPQLEPALEAAMFKCLAGREKLPGATALVIDTSPSMWQTKVSAKSEMDRFEAAAALAILAREVCEDVRIYAFNHKAYVVPPRRGFALRDALAATKGEASCGGLAVALANKHGYDRIIVLTDGQWHTSYDNGMVGAFGEATKVAPAPLVKHAYMLDVSSYQNGVGHGPWNSVTGWSESLIDYIYAAELNCVCGVEQAGSSSGS